MRKKHFDPNQPQLPLSPPPDGDLHGFSDLPTIAAFLYSGNAVITVQSVKTNQHFTYQVKRIPNSDTFAVKYMGSNGRYFYLGAIFDRIKFRMTLKSPPIMKDHPAFLGFKYFHDHLAIGQFAPNIKLWHSGRCGACGRRLTDPLSIKYGIGPECRIKRLNVGA